LGFYHPLVADNAARLVRLSGMDEVSFHMSGTEAVMQAVRLARYHTRRSHLVRFCGAYHGWWGDVQPGVGNPVAAHETYTLKDMFEASLRVLRGRRDIACVLVNPVQIMHPNSTAPADSTLVDSTRQVHLERAAYAEWEGREPGPLVVVDDATVALQRLSRRYRDGWAGLMIGVTGSAGKTTTKDLIAAVLATSAPTLKTEGNLNNHWGVPLTLMRLRPEHRSAVVEIAMNHAGEIGLLAAIARPEAAVITNAGSAHLEGLGSLEAIAREKASLAAALPEGRPVFAGADSPRLMAALRGMKVRIVGYGLAAEATVRPETVTDLGPDGTRFTVSGFPPVHLRLIGRHQVQNALAALAVAREYAVDPAAAVAAIEAQRPAKGRMEVRTLAGATLLVDCYNANPDSTRAALATLADWPGARDRRRQRSRRRIPGRGGRGLRRRRLRYDAARNRPCLGQRNLGFRLPVGGLRGHTRSERRADCQDCRQGCGQQGCRQGRRQGCRSQCGCAGKRGHGSPSRRITRPTG